MCSEAGSYSLSPERAEALLARLKSEVVPALGCTEPAAVALAVAKAREVLGAPPERVSLRLSGNVLKNGMGVGIPGTGLTGLPIAIALSVVGGSSRLGLEVFSEIGPDERRQALAWLETHPVKISLAEDAPLLFIEASLEGGGHSSRVVISGSHTGIQLVERDGQVFEFERQAPLFDKAGTEHVRTSFRDTIVFAEKFDHRKLDFILEGVTLNQAISQEGLNQSYGLEVGRRMAGLIKKGILANDEARQAMIMTASASDARMGGSTLPVMSNSGSGNQGLTVVLPVLAIARSRESSDEDLIRALTQAHLAAIHIKKQLGPLSALCGCVVAAIGATCGIVRLLSPGQRELAVLESRMNAAIRDMVGNITGMICDGAKAGCALKVATAAGTAVESALLALEGLAVSAQDGIIANSIEETLSNLASLGREGMRETDKMVLKMMLEKSGLNRSI